MWQRLKEAVDSRIAEEQARQQRPQSSAARTDAPTRPRSGSRTHTPTGTRRRRVDSDAKIRTLASGNEPDPAEFEADFSVGDDAQSERAATPKPKEDEPEKKEDLPVGETLGTVDEVSQQDEPTKDVTTEELPLDVRQKLKKWDSIQPKYTRLLASYRIAHERNKAIAPFESALRENTPLASIGEPTAFVEYLNQINLKATMLMEELKRVTGQKDELKDELEKSQASTKELEIRIQNLETDAGSSKADASPKVAGGNEKDKDSSDDLFSYESEVPRLQAELEQQEAKIVSLTKDNEELRQAALEVRTTNRDLEESVIRHKKATQSLETDIKGFWTELESVRKQNIDDTAEKETLRRQLAEAKAISASMREGGEDATEAEATMKTLRQQVTELQESSFKLEKRNETVNNLLATLRAQLAASEAEKDRLSTELETATVAKDIPTSADSPAAPSKDQSTEIGANKKKNKKKKKATGKTSAEDLTAQEDDSLQTGSREAASASSTAHEMSDLQSRVDQLEAQIRDKDDTITKLQKKLNDQEGLHEEIEGLKDDLIEIGNNHVQVKDSLKDAMAEKLRLQELLEKERASSEVERKASSIAAAARSTSTQEIVELKKKTESLTADLEASEQLAAARFKELTSNREIMQKAQPELNSLRAEVRDLRQVKEDLAGKISEVKRLEAREKDLREEIAKLKTQILEDDKEIRSLSLKNSQSDAQRVTLEESLRKAQRELQRAQSERKDAGDLRDKLQADISTIRLDYRASQSKAEQLERDITKMRSEGEGLRGDIELKTAQYKNAQDLMNTMQDQAHEIGAQMKEVKARCESLEEELADAHRLLNERRHEAETMRRLVSDADTRADARLKEMRERLDSAVEERDRAEEQANTVGRKRSREVEELRNKIKEAEASAQKLSEERSQLVTREQESTRMREAAESSAARASEELEEIRKTMSQLRDALDETDGQNRELERERSELKRSLEDSQQTLEKSQKINKSMTEEIKTLKQHPIRGIESSRSSFESSRSNTRIGSPVPSKNRMGSIASSAGTAIAAGGPAVDMHYLKNVLLQFMEQKDKKHQMQLVPVLGMLLHFDKQDEQKWTAAITAR